MRWAMNDVAVPKTEVQIWLPMPRRYKNEEVMNMNTLLQKANRAVLVQREI
jgi:hypothetical protein